MHLLLAIHHPNYRYHWSDNPAQAHLEQFHSYSLVLCVKTTSILTIFAQNTIHFIAISAN
jgi:hypothetical protein